MTTTLVHVSLSDAVAATSSAYFSVNFLSNISMPAGSRARVNDVRLINSFQTINAGVNDELWILQNNAISRVTLLPGYFNVLDLTKMLSAALQAFSHSFSLVYNTNQNSITISCSTAFTILTDRQIAQAQVAWIAANAAYLTALQAWQAAPIGAAPTQQGPSTPWTLAPSGYHTVNALLRNDIDQLPSKVFLIPFVLVNPFDTLYLRCRQLTSSDIVTANGINDVLCVINVDQPYGQLLTAQTPNLDSIKLGAAFSSRTLDFYITDRVGSLVNLDAGMLTFTLVFYS